MAKYNQPDPRNAGTWCWVNGLVKREEARVSVLDSVVQGGDAVWEGLRVADGRIYQLEEHLQRLLESAHVLGFEATPSREDIQASVFETLKANGMTDGVHIRLTLTRGEKSTSGMDPRLNVHGCTLIVLPEYKGAVYGSGEIRLITSSVRRNSPEFLDSKIHHNNLLNNILAKMQANLAGV
ncbi:MAG: aminotransferase class IV, partial [Flavobacteriales bacterium]